MRATPSVTWALAMLAYLSAAADPGQPSRISLGDDGLPGVHGAFSALSLAQGEFILGFSAEGHASRTFLSKDHPVTGARIHPKTALFLQSRAQLAIGLGHGIDGTLHVPYYYEAFSGDDLPFTRSRGQGDLAMTLKAALPGNAAGFALGVLLSGTLPLASGEGTIPRELIHHPPSGSYPSPSAWPFGTVDARLGGGLGVTWSRLLPPGPARIHANLVLERPLTPAGMDAIGLARASLAAEAALGPAFRLLLSLDRQELVIDPLDWSADIAEGFSVSPGAAWIPWGWLTLRAGLRLAPAAVNPEARLLSSAQAWHYRADAPAAGFLALSLQGFPLRSDRDGDGMPNRLDRCPRRAEDKDGFEDHDGCPDLDNDRDGILDSLDRCPDAAEDRDGFRDWDGCPDPDNDGDGVVDGMDACGNEAEDQDGVEDQDGCPDLDDDRDGIPDAADRCPREAENKDGFEDADGCPEPDADKDGLADKVDSCPLEPELVNFYQDEDGCPDAKPEPVRSGILAGVAFLSGTSHLLPSSNPALDSLAARLAAYPGTEIEIQGHLDDRSGGGAADLSLERARAVAEYLKDRGVEPRRMKPAGYGPSRPVAPNRTAAGREANRRIEIHRLN